MDNPLYEDSQYKMDSRYSFAQRNVYREMRKKRYAGTLTQELGERMNVALQGNSYERRTSTTAPTSYWSKAMETSWLRVGAWGGEHCGPFIAHWPGPDFTGHKVRSIDLKRGPPHDAGAITSKPPPSANRPAGCALRTSEFGIFRFGF
jgi:hypothetical protein